MPAAALRGSLGLARRSGCSGLGLDEILKSEENDDGQKAESEQRAHVAAATAGWGRLPALEDLDSDIRAKETSCRFASGPPGSGPGSMVTVRGEAWRGIGRQRHLIQASAAEWMAAQQAPERQGRSAPGSVSGRWLPRRIQSRWVETGIRPGSENAPPATASGDKRRARRAECESS